MENSVILAQSSGGGFIVQIIPLLLISAVFYFINKEYQKRAKARFLKVLVEFKAEIKEEIFEELKNK